MLTLVFFVGVVNLVLGFALAVALERRLVIPVIRFFSATRSESPAEDRDHGTEANGAAPESVVEEEDASDSNAPLTMEPSAESPPGESLSETGAASGAVEDDSADEQGTASLTAAAM